MIKKFIAEGIGTMFLVLLACGSAVLAGPHIGTLGIGLCFGLVLLCLCYCLGNISGCHVNPAVSIGMWLCRPKEFGFGQMCGYIICQFIGAAVGAGFLFWYMGIDPAFEFGGITPIEGMTDMENIVAANVLQPGATKGLALMVEILLTFFFVFVVLGATDKQQGGGALAGVAIGLALGLVNIVGIPVDNCSVNPARSFGPALFSCHAWGDFWIMCVGPVCGAILAAIAWKAVANYRAKQEGI